MTGIPIDLKFSLNQVNQRSFQLLHPDDSRSSGVTNRAPTSHGGQLMWAAPCGPKRLWCLLGWFSTMKKYKGIRYGFRPASYWEDLDPLSAILRNVTGENRRQMITDYWNAGKLEELDPALLNDVPDDAARQRLGRIHPSFMGGEYLPGYLPGEVEIARICLRSTTSDVISLRARPNETGIAYRIADEYEGNFSLPITQSKRPLTLAELVRQFEHGWLHELEYDGGLALGYNNMNAEGCDFEDLRNFTRITSTLYRQLEGHFEGVYDDWVKESCAERDRENEAVEDETEELPKATFPNYLAQLAQKSVDSGRMVTGKSPAPDFQIVFPPPQRSEKLPPQK